VLAAHGISDATFYKWKAKYGGMEVSEARKLKGLEDENAKLKRLLADAMLDNAALKDLLSKKWSRPPSSEKPCLTWQNLCDEPAAGVFSHRLLSNDGSLPVGARRRGVAQAPH
jgi:hypothetical protein